MMFRNDDVSYDTDTENLARFCNVLAEFGFVQTHAVTLFGRTGSKFKDGAAYDGLGPMNKLSNEKIADLAKGEPISLNRSLVDFLRNRWQDEIALHGFYHYDYAKVTDPKLDIKASLDIMRNLFTNRRIKRFVAPFNSMNDNFTGSCRATGLIPVGASGVHFEDALSNGLKGLNFFETYRYHHHRFYPDTKFTYYRLSLDLLKKFLTDAMSLQLSPPIIPEKLEVACRENGVESWHNYSNANIYEGARRTFSVLANASKELKVFEVGAGVGLNLLRLKRFGFKNLSGVELEPKAVQLGNQFLGGGLTVGDANTIYPPEKTDIVILYNTGEIIPGFSYSKFIERCSSRLNVGGLLLMDSVWPGGINSGVKAEYATVIDPKELVAGASSVFDLVFYMREQQLCVRDWYVLRKRE